MYKRKNLPPGRTWSVRRTSQMLDQVLTELIANKDIKYPAQLTSNLLAKNGIDWQRLAALGKRYTTLTLKLTQISALMESRVLEFAEDSKNPMFPIFVLQTQHGYLKPVDRQEIMHKGVFGVDQLSNLWKNRNKPK